MEGAEVGYTIDGAGNLVAIGATTYQDIKVSTSPRLSKEAALAIAHKAFAADSARVKTEGVLRILPVQGEQGPAFHLAWKIRLFSLAPLQDVTYFIDAKDGSILRDWSNLRHFHATESGHRTTSRSPSVDSTLQSVPAAALPLGGSLSGTIIGSYYPEEVGDTPTSTGFKTTNFEIYDSIGQRVVQMTTNSDGSWSTPYLASGHYTIRIPLENEWVEVHDGDEDPIMHEYTLWVGGNTTYNYNWAADDGPNVRYHASAMHDFFKGAPFYYSGTDYRMDAYVNQPFGSCGFGSPTAACATGTEMLFGTAGGT